MRLFREARGAYSEISASIINEKYEEAWDRLLDDGEVLDVDRARGNAEFLQDLKRTGQIVRAAAASESEPVGVRVQREMDYELGRGEVGERVRKKEVVTVTWRLEGTVAIVEENMPGGSGLATVGHDGNLIVLMKRIHGRWYWNPFGW